MDSVKGNEEKKAYLNRFSESRKAERRIIDQIKEFESQKIWLKINNNDIGICGSRVFKDLSACMVKEEELISKMIQIKNRHIEIYVEVLTAVEAVPDEREREVLTLRYIECLKWEEIAVKMHVEWAQVHRIHAKALQHFKIPEENVRQFDK